MNQNIYIHYLMNKIKHTTTRELVIYKNKKIYFC